MFKLKRIFGLLLAQSLCLLSWPVKTAAPVDVTNEGSAGRLTILLYKNGSVQICVPEKQKNTNCNHNDSTGRLTGSSPPHPLLRLSRRPHLALLDHPRNLAPYLDQVRLERTRVLELARRVRVADVRLEQRLLLEQRLERERERAVRVEQRRVRVRREEVRACVGRGGRRGPAIRFALWLGE